MANQLLLMIILPVVVQASTNIDGDEDVNITATGYIDLSARYVTVNGKSLEDVIRGRKGENGDVGAAGPPGKPAPEACSCCDRLAALELQLARVGLSRAIPRNCKEVQLAGHHRSGVYTVNPGDGLGAFKVYCDMTTSGGGWTVFQRRQDGSVDFYRGWADYKAGFGDLNGEFWLGLDKIHRLTAVKQTLRIDMADFQNAERYAQYGTFAVADETARYKLTVAQYSGNAGDSLTRHHGMKFSTKDQDNDIYSSGSCANKYFGAWWYEICHSSNLNGKYLKGKHSSYADSVIWVVWKGYYYSLKFSEMKMRPTV